MRSTQLVGAAVAAGPVALDVVEVADGVRDEDEVVVLLEVATDEVVPADDAAPDEQPARVTAATAPSATSGVNERRAGPSTARR